MEQVKRDEYRLVEFDVSSINEGENSPFVGVIKYKHPNYVQRLKILKDLNYGNFKGEVNAKEDLLEISIKLAELTISLIVDVNVTRREDGYIYKSIDDLEFDSDGATLISAIGNRLTSGIKMGKN